MYIIGSALPLSNVLISAVLKGTDASLSTALGFGSLSLCE